MNRKLSKDEKMNIIWGFYEYLLAEGAIKKKGEYAEVLGVSRNVVSGAMNGNEAMLTDNLCVKIKALESKARGLKEGALVPPQSPAIERETEGGVFIPEKTLELYTSLAKTCDRLSAIVDRMLPEIPAGKKHYQTEARD